MRLCKDCAFSRQAGVLPGLLICEGPHLPVSPVDGRRIIDTCEAQRSRFAFEGCGMSGQHWRPKEKPDQRNWLLWWWPK